MIQPFQKLNTQDRIINTLQNNVALSLNSVIALPLNNSNRITNVTLTSGVTNSINHGLGRPLIGWFLTRQRGPGNVYDSQDTNTFSSTTLNLLTTTTVNVDIFVF